MLTFSYVLQILKGLQIYAFKLVNRQKQTQTNDGQVVGYRSIRPRVDPPRVDPPRVDPPHVRPKCGRSAPGLRSIRPRSQVVPPQLFGRIQEGVFGGG